jgi:Holliday junction resolvase
MPRVGQARRRDANEADIVRALRAAGADVTPVSGKGAPDLIVRYRGRVYAFEVKAPKGTRTEAQEESQWPVIRSVDEAFAAVVWS